MTKWFIQQLHKLFPGVLQLLILGMKKKWVSGLKLGYLQEYL